MMTVSIQTRKRQIPKQSMTTGFTHLQLGTSDDQCPASYPRFAVLRDTCRDRASERVMAFRHWQGHRAAVERLSVLL
jgi:hypothetical protein